MAVIAANTTEETVSLLDEVLGSKEFVRFQQRTKLDLSDKTILLRLALINLYQHIPTEKEVLSYKVSLLRPHEFDDFWKKILGVEDYAS